MSVRVAITGCLVYRYSGQTNYGETVAADLVSVLTCFVSSIGRIRNKRLNKCREETSTKTAAVSSAYMSDGLTAPRKLHPVQFEAHRTLNGRDGHGVHVGDPVHRFPGSKTPKSLRNLRWPTQPQRQRRMAYHTTHDIAVSCRYSRSPEIKIISIRTEIGDPPSSRGRNSHSRLRQCVTQLPQRCAFFVATPKSPPLLCLRPSNGLFEPAALDRSGGPGQWPAPLPLDSTTNP